MMDRYEGMLVGFMIYATFEMSTLMTWVKNGPWHSHSCIRNAVAAHWITRISTVLMALSTFDIGIEWQGYHQIVIGIAFFVAFQLSIWLLWPILKQAKASGVKLR